MIQESSRATVQGTDAGHRAHRGRGHRPAYDDELIPPDVSKPRSTTSPDHSTRAGCRTSPSRDADVRTSMRQIFHEGAKKAAGPAGAAALSVRERKSRALPNWTRDCPCFVNPVAWQTSPETSALTRPLAASVQALDAHLRRRGGLLPPRGCALLSCQRGTR